MKIISFSIWGDDPLYFKGAIENSKLVDRIYPGWKMRVYHDSRVPQSALNEMASFGVENILIQNSRGRWDGLFWRFYPASEDNVDVLIVRDTDSRLNSREKAAVDEWLASEYLVHTMRDHYEHNMPILGGMWGVRNGAMKSMKEDIAKWREFDKKGTDQEFLAEIWKRVADICIAHDRYPHGMFKLPSGIVKMRDQVTYYNAEDFCGSERDPNFPRGKIAFNDGSVFQRLDVYEYNPIKFFGPHHIRPFPAHPPIEYGTHVGEIIKL